MPTYVYACTDPGCGHQFEAVQTFTDDTLTECPICEQRLRKVYGSVGVVFKGSGFYRNDSRPTSAESGSTGKDKASDTAGKEKAGAPASSSSGDSSLSSTGSSSNGSSSNGSSSASSARPVASTS